MTLQSKTFLKPLKVNCWNKRRPADFIARGAAESCRFCAVSPRIITCGDITSSRQSKRACSALDFRNVATPSCSRVNRSRTIALGVARLQNGPSLSLRLNPKSGDFSGLGSQVHWTCSCATPLQSAEGREHRLNQSDEVSCRRPWAP